MPPNERIPIEELDYAASFIMAHSEEMNFREQNIFARTVSRSYFIRFFLLSAVNDVRLRHNAYPFFMYRCYNIVKFRSMMERRASYASFRTTLYVLRVMGLVRSVEGRPYTEIKPTAFKRVYYSIVTEKRDSDIWDDPHKYYQYKKEFWKGTGNVACAPGECVTPPPAPTPTRPVGKPFTKSTEKPPPKPRKPKKETD